MNQKRVRVDPKRLASDVEEIKEKLDSLADQDEFLKSKSDYLLQRLTRFASSYVRSQKKNFKKQDKTEIWLYALTAASLLNLYLYFFQ
jgi:regulator of replication initiation timing